MDTYYTRNDYSFLMDRPFASIRLDISKLLFIQKIQTNKKKGGYSFLGYA